MDVFSFLEAVRREGPVVHHLTNWVTIYDCAQVVKSFGASPVMAHAPEEVADMTGIASALVLNIGTLTNDLVESMKIAARAAESRGIPVVLDVCGAGATPFRDQKCLELLEDTRIGIIKGNRSEIARVAGVDVRTKGVDAASVDGDLAAIVAKLASQRHCTVVMTGREDLVADERKLYRISNSVELMSQVVGTGCMAASVIGTFAGAAPRDLTAASVAGLCCYEIAAELAAERSGGPSSFKLHLFDKISALRKEDVVSRLRIAC